MGVLLPWDRKKAAKQEGERSLKKGAARPMPLAVAAVALFSIAYLVLTSISSPVETIWEVPGGRLLSQQGGLWLVDTGNGVAIYDSEGTILDTEAADGRGYVLLGSGGPLRFTPSHTSERVLAVLGDEIILTQRPALGGEFGETWLISAYSLSGKIKWTASVPGAAATVCRRGNCLAVAITDLSGGAKPSVALFNALSGDLLWIRSLSTGSWRALGGLEDEAWVAVLSSGATAFDSSGALEWFFNPGQPILAAALVGDCTCVSFRANRGLQALVYPYRIDALSSDGTVKWSRRVREEPVILQPWMGKEALAAIVENHVLGFNIEDGARMFAERTGADPVNLTGDKLLIRDNRGIRLVRLQSIDLSAP